MIVDQLLTGLEAAGLALVSFQLGGIFWGVVIVHRLGRRAAVPRRVLRVPDGRSSAMPRSTGAPNAGEPTPTRPQLGGAER